MLISDSLKVQTITKRKRHRGRALLAPLFAIVAIFIVLPPIELRTPIPSLLIALIGLITSVWALRTESKRIVATAIAISVCGGLLAYGATRSSNENLEGVVVWSILIGATLRFATPLIFAALGGVICERSGVVNVALEGMMLAGAFFAVFGADITNSWILGILVAVFAGALFGLLHAFFAITLRADQIVAGMAINLIVLGLTGFLFIDRYGDQGTPENIAATPDITLPIGWIPMIGEGIGKLNLLVWVALVSVGIVALFLFRTPLGLRLRAVGENPLAADTAGINVYRVRYLAVTASGMLAALGGAFLSIGFVHSFNPNMTAGRGFIALAAVIFGRWRPGGALAAALLFGFSSAIAQRMPVFSAQAATLFQTLPYVLTLIAVAGLIGKSKPPAAVGLPYNR